uniref:Uncharacterized protein n=1 Tax=Romanomermis culicivorax TaxID=13658 RepID=A0A915IW91_ROMCU
MLLCKYAQIHANFLKIKKRHGQERKEDAQGKLALKRHQDVFEAINHTTIAARFKNIGNTVDSCGEIDKIVEGIFTNYVNVPFKDPSLKLINHGLNWLQMIDKYDRHTEETQTYDFWAYKKYLPILFHLSFASAAQIRLSYPQVFTDALSQRTKYLGLLNTLMDHMAPLNKAFVSANILLHELYPYLIRIIQPNLKPINSQLYTEKDRKELEKVVNIMMDYNLTYRQERNLEGRYEFILEP